MLHMEEVETAIEYAKRTHYQTTLNADLLQALESYVGYTQGIKLEDKLFIIDMLKKISKSNSEAEDWATEINGFLSGKISK